MSMLIGRCYFEGRQPSNSTQLGDITIYYDGCFPCSSSCIGGVTHYEFDGDVWVVYGHYYPGFPRIKVTSRYGVVQEGHL